jgi:hypothetical protein
VSGAVTVAPARNRDVSATFVVSGRSLTEVAKVVKIRVKPGQKLAVATEIFSLDDPRVVPQLIAAEPPPAPPPKEEPRSLPAPTPPAPAPVPPTADQTKSPEPPRVKIAPGRPLRIGTDGVQVRATVRTLRRPVDVKTASGSSPMLTSSSVSTGLELVLAFTNKGRKPVENHVIAGVDASLSELSLVSGRGAKHAPRAIKVQGKGVGLGEYRDVSAGGGIAIRSDDCSDSWPVGFAVRGAHAGLFAPFCTKPGETDEIVALFDLPAPAEDLVFEIGCKICPSPGMTMELDRRALK